MNTSPHTKTILCFGDSNTNGQRADDVALGRWLAEVSWTGQLQAILGSEFTIIEEGKSGRTTNIDTGKADQNGELYLRTYLETHDPVDLVILMIGTNDLKQHFGRDAHHTANAVADLVVDIEQYAATHKHGLKILIVSPIHIDNTSEYFQELYAHDFTQQSVDSSRELASHLQELADEASCGFFDAASVARAGKDGLHFSKESHTSFAQALAPIVRAALAI